MSKSTIAQWHIDSCYLSHHLVRKCSLSRGLFTQEGRTHHRDISKRKQQSSNNSEAYHHSHRREHFTLYTDKREDRNIYD